MKHAVRSTLTTLLVGVVGQRVLQLISFLCIGRALGAEQLGLYAQGVAVAGTLGVLAGAGVRNVLARAVAHDPAAAGSLVMTAVRARLATGSSIAAIAIGIVLQFTADPWFWSLCVLQVLPGAFDLKNLSDVAGRTRVEVTLETGTALLQLVAVVVWLGAGGEQLAGLAAIGLCGRCVYALLAVPAIRRLPQAPAAADALPGVRAGMGIGAAEALHAVLTVGDIWFVALCFGDGASGYYAVATRFAGAALLPSTQLARLLLPHLLHAGASGDAVRTLGKALRATLLVTLPMFAGGVAVAERLCTLPGVEFAGGAPALVLALLSGCLQHSGWQCSHALLAKHRDRTYARCLAWPSVLHTVLLIGAGVLLGSSTFAGDAALAAMTAAGVAVVANTVYCLVAWHAVRDLRARLGSVRLSGPLAVAAATGLAAALPATFVRGPAVLPLQLAAGGFVFFSGIWFAELRGRLRRFGDGLAAASGFRS